MFQMTDSKQQPLGTPLCMVTCHPRTFVGDEMADGCNGCPIRLSARGKIRHPNKVFPRKHLGMQLRQACLWLLRTHKSETEWSEDMAMLSCSAAYKNFSCCLFHSAGEPLHPESNRKQQAQQRQRSPQPICLGLSLYHSHSELLSWCSAFPLPMALSPRGILSQKSDPNQNNIPCNSLSRQESPLSLRASAELQHTGVSKYSRENSGEIGENHRNAIMC